MAWATVQAYPLCPDALAIAEVVAMPELQAENGPIYSSKPAGVQPCQDVADPHGPLLATSSLTGLARCMTKDSISNEVKLNLESNEPDPLSHQLTMLSSFGELQGGPNTTHSMAEAISQVDSFQALSSVCPLISGPPVLDLFLGVLGNERGDCGLASMDFT